METPLFVALTRFDLVQVLAVFGFVWILLLVGKGVTKFNGAIARRRERKAGRQPRPRAERL